MSYVAILFVILRYTVHLFQYRGDSRSATALGKLPDGSWGLLASSSARLAHDLLLYSFEELFSTNCAIVQQPALVADSPTRVLQYYTPTQSPPRASSHTTVASSPAYFTPPTSAKRPQALDKEDDTVLEAEQVQWVFEETKSGRELRDCTDLTQLD